MIHRGHPLTAYVGGAELTAQRIDDDRPACRRLLGLALVPPVPAGHLFEQFGDGLRQRPRRVTGLRRGDPLTEPDPCSPRQSTSALSPIRTSCGPSLFCLL